MTPPREGVGGGPKKRNRLILLCVYFRVTKEETGVWEDLFLRKRHFRMALYYIVYIRRLFLCFYLRREVLLP